MEHTQIVTASELESYSDRRDSEAIIPELVWMLVNESISDLTVCRIPYGDAVNQPGWDGLVETDTGFRQFVPQNRSYWEIGTGSHPQLKATSDFKKRTREMHLTSRQSSSYVFVTPRSAGSGGWPEPAQTKWKQRRESFGWHRISVLDGQQLTDWLREFPSLGKWLAKKIGSVKTVAGFSTPAEHWENLQELKNDGDPPLSEKVFLIGRDRACSELHRLFNGEIRQLLLATESDQDAEDFVAAFLKSLDAETQLAFSNRCLFISDPDAWLSFSNLRTAHVLVANPKLDLESNEQWHMAAKKNGHGVIIPISGTWAHGSDSHIQLRSPSASALETTLSDSGFTSARARELAGAGALSLSAFKRHLRGLGELPPYATWANARVLAQAGLAGQWQGENSADRSAMEDLLGKSYGEWIEVVRDESLRPDTPLIHRNEKWRIISRGEAWSSLGPRLNNDDLDRFEQVALLVLGERDPKFELPPGEHYIAGVRGKVLLHSATIRNGLAESLALLGSRPSSLTSCSRGKAEAVAGKVVRTLLNGADWVVWSSLNSHLPLLAEAAPNEFLQAVEDALAVPSNSPFHGVFAQEASGFGGWNYMSGLLWALEGLAWHPDYLVRVTTILGDLASIDPGGNWANRPINSLNHIFLPWYPQTVASVSMRRSAIEALLQEEKGIGWKVLMGLLPTSHSTTSGSHKPSWRDLVPADWKDGATQEEYWAQVSSYADLATSIAAEDWPKLTELIDRLPDLPAPAYGAVLDLLGSQTIVSLPEGVRLPAWEALVDLATKHRKFSDTQWAMSPEAVDTIEAVAEKLAPRSSNLLHRRLFSERDFDLYEEKGSYEEQAACLDDRRKKAVEKILADGYLDNVIEFAKQVESPRKLGFALGGLASTEIDSKLLPDYFERPESALKAFIGSFVLGRYWSQRWTWVDTQLEKPWNMDQKLTLLTLLPFETETWCRAEDLLGSTALRYWEKAPVNPWGLDEKSLIEATQKLISCGRPHASVECIYLLAHKKSRFPAELGIKALMDALNSKSEADRIDQHHIQEIIKWLQEIVPAESDELFAVEWAYLPLLDHRFDGGGAKTLERRLASSPSFFCEVIAAVFRSDKDERVKQEVVDEARKKVTENAYRLLNGWKIGPLSKNESHFDGEAFAKWLAEVKQISADTGHFRIAMSQIGEALSKAPADPDGLWIHASIAAALDAKDGSEMRSGFATGLFNLRGVYSPDGGEGERKLAAGYRTKAETLVQHGYHRLADSVRGVAEDYERQAVRESERNPFDD